MDTYSFPARKGQKFRFKAVDGKNSMPGGPGTIRS